jgi:hypothetical protein
MLLLLPLFLLFLSQPQTSNPDPDLRSFLPQPQTSNPDPDHRFFLPQPQTSNPDPDLRFFLDYYIIISNILLTYLSLCCIFVFNVPFILIFYVIS